ncbi:MAG: carbohydrate-binding domain-containing protein [Lachnospiraceae bacterium]|nr:carbohydrate-binding domain-containing protein [Lachnospiraceae bacterium]
MIKKNKIHKFRTIIILGLIAATFSMGACKTTTPTAIIEGIVDTIETSAGVSDENVDESNSETNNIASANASVVSMDVADMFSDRDVENEYEESECTIINLDNESIEGSGAEVTSEGIKITEEGEYILTGTYKNKQITVEASEDAKVRLILKEACIDNEKGAAIYIKSADKVFITLADGSANTISGVTKTISEDEETDAAIYSKSDLTVNGEGSLSIKCSDGKGIVSKDDLKITSGNIKIEASDHALSGKDSVRIAGGTINIKAGEDGIHSGNDEDPEKGYVYIADGNIEIDASDDGIHGETKTVIAGGVINIINSEEGIEGAIVEIAGGEINVNSNDDGINASDGSGSSEFEGFQQGEFDPTQFKDFPQGDFDTSQFEGSTPPTVNDFNGIGNKPFQSKDMPSGGFGMNAGDNPGKPGFAEKTGKAVENDASIDLTQSVYILISGGEINVNASGDGIDSNGSIYVTGGNVSISGPENDGNGALDYNSKAVITGGSFIACGSDGMAMNFTGAAQGSLLIKLSQTHDSGEEITVKDADSNILFKFTPSSKFECILISSEDIKEGETYTITVGTETESVTMESLIINNIGAKGGR